MDKQAFFDGTMFDAYRWFGAHLEGDTAVFRTFAPNASRITVTGACNGWGETGLTQDGRSGFWEGRVTGAAAGQYVVPGERYCSYILGEGAFDFCDCGARTPNEMWRDPRDAGGKDVLITRQRKLFAPRGLSFTKASMNSLSPTNAELENGANWALVNDGQSDKGFIDHRAIPIARILSRG